MREIKFRALLEFEDGFKLMLNPVIVSPGMIGFDYQLIQDALKGTKYSLEDDGVHWADEDHFDKMYDLLSGEDWFWAEDVEPMQYTGLKDKSGEGEELYHKDLIVNSSRNGGKPHIVEWSEWYAGWVGVYGGLEYLISTELHEIKKVGNIYENPELHEY
ncbi:hypothetical protein LCGC14_2790960 [marine sediment metagenome]|uniref:YopX protein domain-containing protein n=1 Tax=marine sediment metagenome TaxID=412755 RepID=A0A0F8ZCM6_9ZZZZ